ncbi:MAG: hypothetical protein RL215_3335 [Planctomycetota bacterium]
MAESVEIFERAEGAASACGAEDCEDADGHDSVDGEVEEEGGDAIGDFSLADGSTSEGDSDEHIPAV